MAFGSLLRRTGVTAGSLLRSTSVLAGSLLRSTTRSIFSSRGRTESEAKALNDPHSYHPPLISLHDWYDKINSPNIQNSQWSFHCNGKTKDMLRTVFNYLSYSVLKGETVSSSLGDHFLRYLFVTPTDEARFKTSKDFIGGNVMGDVHLAAQLIYAIYSRVNSLDLDTLCNLNIFIDPHPSLCVAPEILLYCRFLVTDFDLSVHPIKLVLNPPFLWSDDDRVQLLNRSFDFIDNYKPYLSVRFIGTSLHLWPDWIGDVTSNAGLLHDFYKQSVARYRNYEGIKKFYRNFQQHKNHYLYAISASNRMTDKEVVALFDQKYNLTHICFFANIHLFSKVDLYGQNSVLLFPKLHAKDYEESLSFFSWEKYKD